MTYLDLSENEISKLPTFIGNFTKLEYLNLRNNQLTELPESFSNLKSLLKLELSDNYLSKIPACLRNRSTLTIIGENKQLTTPHLIEKKGQLPQSTNNNKMKYIQKILFGSPGTGKSHQIDQDIYSGP